MTTNNPKSIIKEKPEIKIKRSKLELMKNLQNITLINKYTNVYPSDVLLKNIQLILLFFSSIKDSDGHRKLLKELLHLHAIIKDKGIRLEILFVSVDESKENFEECFSKQGNWYAIQFDSDVIKELIFLFGVTRTPSVIVIRKDGLLITNSGDEDLLKYGINALVSWM